MATVTPTTPPAKKITRMMQVRTYARNYARLMRLNKPIGIYLLLWPTLWALWLANAGMPSTDLLLIFVLGTVCMRSFGCVVNDMADRRFDIEVERTRDRPLATGIVSMPEATVIACVLLMMSLVLVWYCNWFTIQLAFVAAAIAVIYPFLKRFTHLPQLGLGFAFSFGVLMAFAASLNRVPSGAWLLFAAAVIWPVVYDTMYAMVDRADDLRIGVKSTAILFGKYDRVIIGVLQVVFVVLMSAVGWVFRLDISYQYCLFIVVLLCIYQQVLIHKRVTSDCFLAFKNNNYVGMMIFAGILWGLAS